MNGADRACIGRLRATLTLSLLFAACVSASAAGAISDDLLSRISAKQREWENRAALAHREERRIASEQAARENAVRRVAAEQDARARAEEEQRARAVAQERADRERRAAQERAEQDRARAAASLDKLAEVEKVKAINQELDRARSYLSVEQYNEAFDAVRRALELDSSVTEARSILEQIVRDVPHGSVTNPYLAQLVFQPETLDPPPVRIPDHLQDRYVQMGGRVAQYFNGYYIVRQGDNSFAFRGTGNWSVSIADHVLVIGKPDGEFTGVEVLGALRSMPRLKAVFVVK